MSDPDRFDEVTRALASTMAGVAERADLLLVAARRCAGVVAAGGTLWVDSADMRRPHAEHVAVEFVHPVITGKRAVPALVVEAGGRALGRTRDGRVWLGPGPDPRVSSGSASGSGYVDLAAVVGRVDERFSDVAMVLVHHLLWELTHAFVEQSPAEDYLSGLDVGARRGPTTDDISEKVTTSTATISATVIRHEARLRSLAGMLGGGESARRVWVLGQGGSAADAAVAALRLGGTCLSTNPAVLTALVNDIGPDAVYVRQIDTHVRHDDVVIALTTSGASSPVLAALAAANSIGALTVACTGAGGLVGAAESPPSRTTVLAVASDSIHRIQEAHLAVVGVLAAVAERS